MLAIAAFYVIELVLWNSFKLIWKTLFRGDSAKVASEKQRSKQSYSQEIKGME